MGWPNMACTALDERIGVSPLQEIDVEKKMALCRAQISYEDGRRPQFEVGLFLDSQALSQGWSLSMLYACRAHLQQ